MHEDEVIEEVRRIKDEIAAEFHYNVHALAESLRADEGKDGSEIVSFSPRRPVAVKKA